MTQVEPKHYRRGDWLTKVVLAVVVITGISYAVKEPTVSGPDPERVALAGAPDDRQSVEAAPAKGAEPGHPAAPRKWSYSDDTDSISGKTERLAWSVSTNSFQFKWPYNGTQNAALHLRYHPRWGKDVFLSFESGQFNCPLDGCRIMVRFDDGKPMAFSAVEPDDHSTTVLFISDYGRFVGALRKAKKVAIEASVYQNGNQVFEFNVAGLEWR